MEQKPVASGAHHRRALSDTTFRFDDLLLFEPSDLPPSSYNPTPPPVIAVPTDSSDESSSLSNPRHISSHLRSLSVDSDFFEGLGLTGPAISGGTGDDKFGGKLGGDGVGEKRAHHRHTNSMDGSSFEAQSFMDVDGVKTTMAPERLAELALIDPKRAKRVLANRQSAARSKERKVRYTGELERKVQTLQTEATNLSAQVTVLQRDTTGLTSENKELKIRLQAMEQQAQLRDALNDALREEVQWLKIEAGQMSAMNGNPFNRGPLPQFLPHQPAPQQHVQMPRSSNNNQTLNGQSQPRFMDFNRNK